MIVDVFRAFTTAAFCVAAGAREIVLVNDHGQALAMKRADPTLFLTGEIDGRPIPGFDIGNSPSAIERLDLKDPIKRQPMTITVARTGDLEVIGHQRKPRPAHLKALSASMWNDTVSTGYDQS